MRKITVFENVSLDGYFAGPNGEIDWFVAEPGGQAELDEFAADSIKSTEMLLFGRVTYELMASYWSTADAMKSNPVVAERMNNLPKIVFSRTLDDVKWQNTRLVKGNIEEEIKKMKCQPGGNMAIMGSGSIVSALAQLGLIDEYSIMVNPVVLGAGRSVFQGVRDRLHLKLLETRTFKNSGNVLLSYQFVK
ncbi:MAG TPA: dihydrofolate reductase family protein [Methanotrichaceae archaeon]|nr:dihydrofolate reductase family protein [Methanotrichaceae archaeon]